MDNLVEKLSSYNLLNFLLPGASFLLLLPYVTSISLMPPDIFPQLVMSYFVGLVLSRIGSIFLEWPMVRLKLIRASEYTAYVTASKSDGMILIILETCNMYRTFAAAAWVMLIIVFIDQPVLNNVWLVLGSLAVALLLTLSFGKQFGYVRRRVEANCGGGVL